MSAAPEAVDDGQEPDDGREPDAIEGWRAERRRRRAERGPMPSLDEAITAFTAELPEVVVVADDEGAADPPVAVPAARRVGVDVHRSGRRVTFRASYESTAVAKQAVLEMRFPQSRLRRHAREEFVDVSGFTFDEIFEIQEVLFHVIDWWTAGDEHHRWPNGGGR
ncbi:MAG TPA: hypothetical protein VGM93_03030 [Acidimicrobiales bacterium]